MHCGILACALVAFVLISVGTCTPVSPYDRYALRTMIAAAEKYNARLIRPIRANGYGGYDPIYGHYKKYDVTLMLAYHHRPNPYYICEATGHWSRGHLYNVVLYWSCRPASQ